MLVSRLGRMLLAGLMALAANAVSGQEYPNKVVRIVTGTVGGGLDFAARLMAQGLTSSVGQQAIVDNVCQGVDCSGEIQAGRT